MAKLVFGMNQSLDGYVISRRAATVMWNDPTGSAALGHQLALMLSGPTYTVVGVVGDVRDHDLATAPSPTIYLPQVVPTKLPAEPGARRTMALVVRTAGPSAAVVGAVRAIVRDLDPPSRSSTSRR